MKDMKILVVGRHNLHTIEPNSAVISISDDPDNYPELPDGCLASLRLHFHDIEVSMSDSDDFLRKEEPLKSFTAEQALKVADFVMCLPDGVKTLVMQCEVGISRSAGMAAAVSRYLRDDDMRFFKRYLPNRLVYRLTLEAMRKQGNMGDLKNIERRLARLESKNLSGMRYEAVILHRDRVGDLRVEMARAAIGEIVNAGAADSWMDSPNKVFGWRTPTEVARVDPDIIRQTVHAIGSGEPI